MKAISFLFEKSVADIKREYKKKIMKHKAEVPASKRRAERHDDKISKQTIGHKMDEFEIGLKRKGEVKHPSFDDPGPP